MQIELVIQIHSAYLEDTAVEDILEHRGFDLVNPFCNRHVYAAGVDSHRQLLAAVVVVLPYC